MSEVVIWFSIGTGNFWHYSILLWQTSALYKIEYYISNLYIPYGQRNDQLDHICIGEVHFHHQYPRSSQLQKPMCRPMREKYMSRKIMSLTDYKWNPSSSNVIALDDLKIKGKTQDWRQDQKQTYSKRSHVCMLSIDLWFVGNPGRIKNSMSWINNIQLITLNQTYQQHFFE